MDTAVGRFDVKLTCLLNRAQLIPARADAGFRCGLHTLFHQPRPSLRSVCAVRTDVRERGEVDAVLVQPQRCLRRKAPRIFWKNFLIGPEFVLKQIIFSMKF